MDNQYSRCGSISSLYWCSFSNGYCSVYNVRVQLFFYSRQLDLSLNQARVLHLELLGYANEESCT